MLQLAKSSKERESVQEEARRRIENSPAVKQRLGNVRVRGACHELHDKCFWLT